MGSYILRRLALIIPTLLGIMLLNFVIVQAAPGGPVEQMISEVEGFGGNTLARASGGGSGGEISSGGDSRSSRCPNSCDPVANDFSYKITAVPST